MAVLFVMISVVLLPVESKTADVVSNPITKILVSNPDDPVISPHLQQKISRLGTGETVVLWIFFTDKCLFSEREYMAAVKRLDAKRSDRVKKRLAKMGQVKIIDFKDLPVHETYIDRIKAMSVKHRTTSRWLNAISVEIEVGKLTEIAELPFVRKIQEVVRLRRRPVPESPKVEEPRHKSPSSPNTHELNYGSSYNQLQQINVPAVKNSILLNEVVERNL